MEKKSIYSTPELEVIEVNVEGGFAASYGSSNPDDFNFGGDLSN